MIMGASKNNRALRGIDSALRQDDEESLDEIESDQVSSEDLSHDSDASDHGSVASSESSCNFNVAKVEDPQPTVEDDTSTDLEHMGSIAKPPGSLKIVSSPFSTGDSIAPRLKRITDHTSQKLSQEVPRILRNGGLDKNTYHKNFPKQTPLGASNNSIPEQIACDDCHKSSDSQSKTTYYASDCGNLTNNRSKAFESPTKKIEPQKNHPTSRSIALKGRISPECLKKESCSISSDYRNLKTISRPQLVKRFSPNDSHSKNIHTINSKLDTSASLNSVNGMWTHDKYEEVASDDYKPRNRSTSSTGIKTLNYVVGSHKVSITKVLDLNPTRSSTRSTLNIETNESSPSSSHKRPSQKQYVVGRGLPRKSLQTPSNDNQSSQEAHNTSMEFQNNKEQTLATSIKNTALKPQQNTPVNVKVSRGYLASKRNLSPLHKSSELEPKVLNNSDDHKDVSSEVETEKPVEAFIDVNECPETKLDTIIDTKSQVGQNLHVKSDLEENCPTSSPNESSKAILIPEPQSIGEKVLLPSSEKVNVCPRPKVTSHPKVMQEVKQSQKLKSDFEIKQNQKVKINSDHKSFHKVKVNSEVKSFQKPREKEDVKPTSKVKSDHEFIITQKPKPLTEIKVETEKQINFVLEPHIEVKDEEISTDLIPPCENNDPYEQNFSPSETPQCALNQILPEVKDCSNDINLVEYETISRAAEVDTSLDIEKLDNASEDIKIKLNDKTFLAEDNISNSMEYNPQNKLEKERPPIEPTPDNDIPPEIGNYTETNVDIPSLNDDTLDACDASKPPVQLNNLPWRDHKTPRALKIVGSKERPGWRFPSSQKQNLPSLRRYSINQKPPIKNLPPRKTSASYPLKRKPPTSPIKGFYKQSPDPVCCDTNQELLPGSQEVQRPFQQYEYFPSPHMKYHHYYTVYRSPKIAAYPEPASPLVGIGQPAPEYWTVPQTIIPSQSQLYFVTNADYQVNHPEGYTYTTPVGLVCPQDQQYQYSSVQLAETPGQEPIDAPIDPAYPHSIYGYSRSEYDRDHQSPHYQPYEMSQLYVFPHQSPRR